MDVVLFEFLLFFIVLFVFLYVVKSLYYSVFFSFLSFLVCTICIDYAYLCTFVHFLPGLIHGSIRRWPE